MKENSNTKCRNNQIEGLRGLAVCLILVYHLFCRFAQLYLDSNYLILQYFGSLGTSFFLIITSFYLGNSVFQQHNFSFHKFLKKKISRLWPTYAICVILIFIVLYMFPLPGRTPEWKDLFLNIFFLNGYIGTQYIDGSHWYLTTILSFFVVIGFFKSINISQKWWSYTIWIIIGVISKYFKLTVLSNMLGNGFIGYAIIGILLYSVFYKNKKLTKGWIFNFIISIIYIFCITGIKYGLELLIVIPLFLAAQGNKLSVLERRLPTKFGTISYPTYLIHQNIGFVIEFELMNYFGVYSSLYAVLALICVVTLGVIISMFFR